MEYVLSLLLCKLQVWALMKWNCSQRITRISLWITQKVSENILLHSHYHYYYHQNKKKKKKNDFYIFSDVSFFLFHLFRISILPKILVGNSLYLFYKPNQLLLFINHVTTRFFGYIFIIKICIDFTIIRLYFSSKIFIILLLLFYYT